ncbi:hypothetical protein KY308_00080 [Candidatus Woesearchaeota archaeon]|nr:hypothetical protein [Candidatus Woesearchaeota archaeon]
MQGKINIDPKAWLNKAILFFKNFKNLPKDEQMAWAAIFLGVVFVIVGLAL